jgi:hypothetical protein
MSRTTYDKPQGARRGLMTRNNETNTKANGIKFGKNFGLDSKYLNTDILLDFDDQKNYIKTYGTELPVEKNTDLKYKFVESTKISDVNDLYKDVFPLMGIMVVDANHELQDKSVDTKFKGHVEDTFIIGNGIREAVFLTKGPLGEIYQNKFTKLSTLYDTQGTILHPKQENRTVVKVDLKLYTSMKKIGLFNAKGVDGLVIRPSYNKNSVMKVLTGDFIVVHDTNFYRVYGPAFDATYKIRTETRANSQRDGSNKVRVLGRERNVTKVGRKQMVTYNGKHICLTDARKLEKQLHSRSTATRYDGVKDAALKTK